MPLGNSEGSRWQKDRALSADRAGLFDTSAVKLVFAEIHAGGLKLLRKYSHTNVHVSQEFLRYKAGKTVPRN